MASPECFFSCGKDEKLITGGQQRIDSLISASITRNDTYHVQLMRQLENDPELQITFHKSCISTYTSSTHIQRYLKRMNCNSNPPEAPKPKLRSDHVKFNFREHCLICNEICKPKDPKNPARWERVVACRTIDRKQELLKICDERGDDDAGGVRLRINSAISDLHAADAQYHYDCYRTFTGKRQIAAAAAMHTSSEPTTDHTAVAFAHVKHKMQEDPARIWNSVDIFDVYCNAMSNAESPCSSLSGTGNVMRHDDVISNRNSRAALVRKLEKEFGESITVLRVTGCASLVCFRKHLPETLKLISANDNDDVDELANKITNEVRSKSSKSVDVYNLGEFVLAKAQDNCSESLLCFISKLISKGAVTKKSLSLTQSIQSLISKSFNQTTLGLAVQLHYRFGSREIIDILHSYGYLASYDEVRRFRKSAAKMTGEHDFSFRGLHNDGGLISSWFDNFDLQVYTPNGCRETHAMAIEFTQHVNDIKVEEDVSAEIKIPRISKHELNSVKTSGMSYVDVVRYGGGKKPLPPEVSNHVGQLFKHCIQTSASITAALNSDMKWLVDVVNSTDGNNPQSEWSGTMATLAKDSCCLPAFATRFLFGPLIDSPPAHPDTVLTTLIFIEDVMKQHNMAYMHVSADMQLYKVIQEIKWSQPTRWQRMVVRPGGMHTLMSFIGCIGTLMNSSGLEELLNASFKGVMHMLNGKAWPKAVRGFRMVVTALLEPFILAGITTVEGLEDEFEKIRQSRTGRLWIDCLIIPVTIINLYLRAEREGDWLLHMYALKRMRPYFFAAGHWNYARYVSWHLQEMESSLPEFMLSAFLRGEHVCRHHDGIFNSVFLDQFGEQTYIRYGKSKGGLVGKSLAPEQVSDWILSHHICNTLSLLMDSMFEEPIEDYDVKTGCHKECGEKRRKVDAADRNKIREELARHTNPLELQPGDSLCNIINGRTASNEVNVDNAVSIGDMLATTFLTQLPHNFYKPIKKQVISMEVMKKRVKVGETSIYDMEKLFARLLVVSQSRDLNLSDVFMYELSPIPPALFDDYGDMRKGNKAALILKLAVFSEVTLHPVVDIELVDGNEALYHTLWPMNQPLKTFANNFVRSLERSHDIYIIFDQYAKQSIKSHERQRRAKGMKPTEYVLTHNTVLPAKEIIMKSDDNKRSLIQYICASNITNPHMQLIGEDCVYRHEEADVKIISYLLELLPHRRHIQILADDTDIFVLLVFFVWHFKPDAQVSMKKYTGQVIDINATTLKLGNKCYDLLALHALSGCDTTSYPFGKGKLTAVNLLMKHDLKLNVFADPETAEADWMKAGMNFLSYLYCGKAVDSLSKLRYTLFSKKKDTPKIKTLPPTDKSAIEHVKRARLQVLIWRAAEQINPPITDLSLFGWKLEDNIPVPVHGNTDVAPNTVLQLVACGCQSNKPCSRGSCSCRSARLTCTSYCKCQGNEQCENDSSKINTPSAVETDDDSDSDDNDAYEEDEEEHDLFST